MDQSERIEEAAKGVLGKNLDAVESSVDTVIDKAKSQLHEFVTKLKRSRSTL